MGNLTGGQRLLVGAIGITALLAVSFEGEKYGRSQARAVELDAHLADDVVARILGALAHEPDAAKLDALALETDKAGAPLTAKALRDRAAELRAKK